MNIAAAITLAAALFGAFTALVSWRLARAPLWADFRKLSFAAATTATFGLLDLSSLLELPTKATAAFALLTFASGVLLVWAWTVYGDAFCERQPTRVDHWVRRGLLAASVLALLPGFALDVAWIHADADPILGGTWRYARMTPAGLGLTAALLAVGVRLEARFLRAWRAGIAGAGMLAVAFAGAAFAGAFDALLRADRISGPHVVVIGLALPLLAAAWLFGVRLVSDADSFSSLRDRLEGLVESRTRDLAQTHAALLQAEKLAALGQFSAGVAHEVNNPASVVTANLSHLASTMGSGRALDPADAKELVDESLDAMRRINELVRKLLDAGRLADLPPGTGTVALAPAVAAAIDQVRQRTRREVQVVNRVPDDLLVRGGDEVVERVLTNLLVNAVESIPAGREGRVEVTARTDGPNVLAQIEDDGGGMGSDVLRRAFDPFFTTKPVGRGSGLGLPITRGLVEGIGGQIWLESEPGKGTRAVVELPMGKPG